MCRFPMLAKNLPAAIGTAWWDAFSLMWDRIDEEEDVKHGLVESSPGGEFAPEGDPANADWD